MNLGKLQKIHQPASKGHSVQIPYRTTVPFCGIQARYSELVCTCMYIPIQNQQNVQFQVAGAIKIHQGPMGGGLSMCLWGQG